jgi:hypothetical protein
LLSLFFRSLPLLPFETLSFDPQFLRSGPLSTLPLFLQPRFLLEFLLPVCLAHLHHRLSLQFLLLPFGEHLMWHPRAAIGTVRQTRRATDAGNQAISARGRRNSFRRGDLRSGEWVDRQTDTCGNRMAITFVPSRIWKPVHTRRNRGGSRICRG